jgi:hypothetical protein
MTDPKYLDTHKSIPILNGLWRRRSYSEMPRKERIAGRQFDGKDYSVSWGRQVAVPTAITTHLCIWGGDGTQSKGLGNSIEGG